MARKVAKMLERFKYALRMKRRRRPLFVWMRLDWHDFVRHTLFGPAGEICQDCGRSYMLWHAEGNLWKLVHGTSGGLLCLKCFDRQAQRAGYKIEFRAIPFPSPFNLV